MTKKYRYILVAIITLLFTLIVFEYIVINNQIKEKKVFTSELVDDFHHNMNGTIDIVDNLYIYHSANDKENIHIMLGYLDINLAQLRTNITLYSLLLDDNINLSIRFNNTLNEMIFNVMDIDRHLRENDKLNEEDIEMLNEMRHDIVIIRDMLGKEVLLRANPDEIRSLLNTIVEDSASSEVRHFLDEKTYSR